MIWKVKLLVKSNDEILDEQNRAVGRFDNKKNKHTQKFHTRLKSKLEDMKRRRRDFFSAAL